MSSKPPKKSKSKKDLDKHGAVKDDAVQVFVRFRPCKKGKPESSQITRLNTDMIRVESSAELDSSHPKSPPTFSREKSSDKHSAVTPSASNQVRGGMFKFHRVFAPASQNDFVYENTTKSFVDSMFDGINCTVMCYGMSGSGKTSTIYGRHEQTGSWNDRGIIPRFLEDMFARVEERKSDGWVSKVTVSNIQIYMERIHDLLKQRDAKFDPEKEPSLNIRERTEPDGSREIYVESCIQKDVKDTKHALKWLNEGNSNRVTAETQMNAMSSRSHSVFVVRLEQINLESSSHIQSCAYLVDLAGSEVQKRTGAEGLVLQQACFVNKSLTILSTVISALANKRQHVPYRDSKLTRLLTHALGGNSRTAVILACSPSHVDLQETVSTLQFGSRALDMPNKPKINNVMTIEDYKRLLEKAEETMNKQKLIIKSLEKENDRLMRQVTELGGNTSKVSRVTHQVEAIRRSVIMQGEELPSVNESSVAETSDGEGTAEEVKKEESTTDKSVLQLRRKMDIIRKSIGQMAPQDMDELSKMSRQVQMASPDPIPPKPTRIVTPRVLPPDVRPSPGQPKAHRVLKYPMRVEEHDLGGDVVEMGSTGSRIRSEEIKYSMVESPSVEQPILEHPMISAPAPRSIMIDMDHPDISAPRATRKVRKADSDPSSSSSSEDDEHDERRARLPPLVRSVRRPTPRYFTPRSLAALKDDMVSTLMSEKSALEDELKARRDEIGFLREELGVSRAETTAAEADAKKAKELKPKTEDKKAAEKSAEPVERYSLTTSDPNYPHTQDIATITVGSVTVVAIYVALLIMVLKYKYPVSGITWGMLGGLTVGGILLGWGFPKVN